MNKMLTRICLVNFRASSTSVVTARSSASRMANPSRFSCSAKTPAASLGLCSSDDRIRRVSLRSVPSIFAGYYEVWGGHWAVGRVSTTGLATLLGLGLLEHSDVQMGSEEHN